MKENINPIYESPSPLYENMEEEQQQQQQQQQQQSGFTPLPCAERMFSIDNIYHSHPISNSGMYSEVGKRKCQPSGTGERGEAIEEDEYTVMRTPASSNAVSSTPYHEDRVDWLY